MTDKRKDEMLNQGDDVVERLKDAANRMLNGDIIGHNLSVFATDILTILNRAASTPSAEVSAVTEYELEKMVENYKMAGVPHGVWTRERHALYDAVKFYAAHELNGIKLNQPHTGGK